MDELKALESMGFVLPNGWYIFGAMLFGLLGFIANRRGTAAKQPGVLWTGVAPML